MGTLECMINEFADNLKNDGFSDEEICKIKKTNAVEFGLGSRILRAETACIALASIVGYVVGV